MLAEGWGKRRVGGGYWRAPGFFLGADENVRELVMAVSPHKYTKLHGIVHFLKWWILWYFLNEENEKVKKQDHKELNQKTGLAFPLLFLSLPYSSEAFWAPVFALVTLCWSGCGGDVRVPVCRGVSSATLTPWLDPHPHVSIEWGYQETHLSMGAWITLDRKTPAPGGYQTWLAALYWRVRESGVDEKDLVNSICLRGRRPGFHWLRCPFLSGLWLIPFMPLDLVPHPHSHHSLKN